MQTLRNNKKPNMGNRFRLRISGIIPVISFQPCGSKDHSHDHINPIPKPDQKKPHRHSFLKRHVSSAFSSCGIAGRSKLPALSSSDCELGRTESEPPSPPSNKIDCFSKWQKEEKYWQLVEITETPRQKVYHCSSADENDAGFPPPPPPPPSSSENDAKHRRVKQRKKKTRSTRLGSVGRVSTSSAESGLFTSSEIFDDETETLVSSSRSLSTDSSCSRRSRRKKRTKAKRLVVESCTAETEAAAARLSVFQRMIPCRVDGKVRESFAVVKRSEDPYEDFKRSMMEMILEKQMFDDEDLELLLHCFLSLNSKNHHGLIVRAFVEIWEALFCGPVR